MKTFKILLMALCATLFIACDDDDDDKKTDPVVVEDGTYSGTLTVDQNDGTFYVQKNTTVALTFDEKGMAEVEMRQVSFSEGMPVKLDMTIPGITVAESESGVAFSGDNIIPIAMGGEFPRYKIVGLSGSATPSTIVLIMDCGGFPLKFEGIANES